MQKPLDRITFNPQVMGGRACIRGMRITVSLVLSLIANGLTNAEILSEYPELEAEDIKASLLYAAFLANEEVRSFVESKVLQSDLASKSLSKIMEEIADRAEKRGLTPEILQLILKNDEVCTIKPSYLQKQKR